MKRPRPTLGSALDRLELELAEFHALRERVLAAVSREQTSPRTGSPQAAEVCSPETGLSPEDERRLDAHIATYGDEARKAFVFGDRRVAERRRTEDAR